MRLPEIQLDDRRFQDLVSEARLKINRACPEWTEHNVSDPGITLIELFAWMTEMTIYRLNRVPDKLHVALLDLLGIRLDGPTAARTDVRFRLAAPPEEPVEIPGGETEIATPRTPNEESIVFQVDEDFTIPAMRPSAYVVQRGNQIKDVGVADGEARPQGADQLPFGAPPAVGDALYLGFEEPIGRLLLQVDVDASQARGAGVNPEDPPLRWEVSQPEGGWEEAEVLEDLTGGFNYGSGHRRAAVPRAQRRAAARRPPHALDPLPDRRPHAPRRRGDDLLAPARDLLDHGDADRRAAARPRTRRRSRTSCSGSPTARPARSSRCATARCSSPGRARRSRSRTRSPATGRRWELREDFVSSTEFDRHFCLDRVSGDVELGPAIRETDGGWTQYGAVPPKGAVLRFTRYRHGGGRRGNITAGALAVLRAHDPRRRQRHEPAAGRRRRRRRGARARPPARVDGDPHALPRGHRRGLRVPRRRGLPARRARGLHPAAGRRRRAAAHRPARLPGRPPAHLRGARARRGPADRGRRIPRRAAADRHDGAAAAVQVPRPLRRRQPPGLPARRHRAGRGGRGARALHVPEPAGGRQRDRRRARAGRSAARSTRASSTASSTRSTASSS